MESKTETSESPDEISSCPIFSVFYCAYGYTKEMRIEKEFGIDVIEHVKTDASCVVEKGIITDYKLKENPRGIWKDTISSQDFCDINNHNQKMSDISYGEMSHHQKGTLTSDLHITGSYCVFFKTNDVKNSDDFLKLYNKAICDSTFIVEYSNSPKDADENKRTIGKSEFIILSDVNPLIPLHPNELLETLSTILNAKQQDIWIRGIVNSGGKTYSVE